MKVFLDSSFFFPFIRVDVRNISKNEIGTLLRNANYEILCSDLVFFELSAKGSKIINQGLLDLEDLLDGISFIHNYSKITKIPMYYPEILILAQEFRKTHQDYIDCLILASAIKTSNIFVTMDSELQEKIQKKWFQVITNENPTFLVKTFSDIAK
jgi:predicted nucleic acid-binding protein